MSKKSKLDQYYTNIDVVKTLIGELPKDRFYIEPSAGDGAFLTVLNDRNYIAFDIEPKGPNIIKDNFLSVDWAKYKLPNPQQTIVIGNPPFGKNSALAVKFFNKSCEFADEIRFILPKTFRKISIHSKLNKKYHLCKDIDVEKNAFLLNGETYDVPCCFQIWERKTENRVCEIKKNSDYFEFVNKSGMPDIAVRRVGGRAGQLLDGLDYASVSTYFIKLRDPKIREAFEKIDLSEIRDSTAGVRSVSKHELIEEVEKIVISSKQ